MTVSTCMLLLLPVDHKTTSADYTTLYEDAASRRPSTSCKDCFIPEKSAIGVGNKRDPMETRRGRVSQEKGHGQLPGAMTIGAGGRHTTASTSGRCGIGADLQEEGGRQRTHALSHHWCEDAGGAAPGSSEDENQNGRCRHLGLANIERDSFPSSHLRKRGQ